MDEKDLQGIALFESLSKRERKEVARHADDLDVEAGKQLIGEGEFAYEFFVIKDGTAEVRRGDEVIAERGPGDFVGEMGILARDRRNATVTAASPMTVIVMTSRDFGAMERELPDVAKKIRAAVEQRTKQLSTAG
jgi:CRP-like cAMP-binding protein